MSGARTVFVILIWFGMLGACSALQDMRDDMRAIRTSLEAVTDEGTP